MFVIEMVQIPQYSSLLDMRGYSTSSVVGNSRLGSRTGQPRRKVLLRHTRIRTFGIRVPLLDEHHDASACYKIFFYFSRIIFSISITFPLFFSNHLFPDMYGLLIFHADIVGTADPARCNYVVYESLLRGGAVSAGGGERGV